MDARTFDTEPGGRYRIEGRAADGRLLFTRRVNPAAVDHAPGLGGIAATIPVTADVEEALASIEVRGPAGAARIGRRAAAGARRTAGAPARERRGSVVNVTCDDPESSGVLVRNEDTGAVLGASRGSRASVVVRAGARLTVVCTDGVRSTRATVITP
jgi:hypothetical protein